MYIMVFGMIFFLVFGTYKINTEISNTALKFYNNIYNSYILNLILLNI